MGTIRVLLLLALTVTVATGVSALWTPFGVDQAIFAYGAHTITSGGVLYRDFWDIKPPGIFGFYAAAGALFGDTEIGIHAADLLWQLCLALVLVRLASFAVTHRWTALLAPVAAIGPYWVHGGSEHLTQIEALVGLPIALSLLLVQQTALRGPSAGRTLLLGVSIGLVAAMKPLYVPLPVSFIFVALVTSGQAILAESLRSGIWKLAAAGLMGIGLVWLPMIGYFLYHGVVHDFVWTTFVYPSEALRDATPAPAARLASSAAWLARVYAPYLPLLVCGLASWRRPHRTLMTAGVAAYLLLGISLILIQKISWWEYHFVLLFPPLGLLASLGLDRIFALRPLRELSATAVTGLVGMLLILPVADMAASMARRARALDRARQIETTANLPIRLDPGYLKIWQKTEFLRQPEQSQPGRVFVFGDFRHLTSSGRRQAIATHGHAWHHLPHHVVQEQADRLVEASPTYIFVGGFYREFLQRRTPGLWRYIERNYRPVRRHGSGRWYLRRPPNRRPADRG